MLLFTIFPYKPFYFCKASSDVSLSWFGHLSFLSYSLGQFSQKFDNVVDLFKKSTFDCFIFDSVVDLFKKSVSDFFISSIIFMFSISFISLLIFIIFSLPRDWI